jgi:FolB domain-containing protein
MYTIKLKNLKINSSHGYYSFEHEREQEFVVNIEVNFKEKTIPDGDLEKSVNYETLRSITHKTFQDHKYLLLEVLSKDILEKIKSRFSFLKYIRVEIEKTNIFPDSIPSVSIERHYK